MKMKTITLISGLPSILDTLNMCNKTKRAKTQRVRKIVTVKN